MDAATIAMNNEAIREGSENLLRQIRDEGAVYRLWVDGTARGATLHLRVRGLTAELKHRIVKVLHGRGVTLDIQAEAREGGRA